MITSPAWAGRGYAVLGLARSGAATVRALVASGARVVAWDSDEAKRVAIGPSAEGPGLVSFADPLAYDLATVDALIVSPGVPLNTHPVAAQARDAGIPIIGDIELFAQARASLPAHKLVGITGTNGKSTTTALVHHILQAAGIPSLMGGNIGLPILEQDALPEGGAYVLELSSYQIDLTRRLDCDVAVLLNITPDHLDRYDGFDAYAASKARLFAMQSPGRLAVVDGAAEAAFGVLDEAEDPIVEFIADIALDGQGDWPSLQGPHNLLNARAAAAVARELGVAEPVIHAALASFTGLPHRMQRIAERHGVAFVDDSKATNAESVAPALAAFARIHWILGGVAKTADLDPCLPYLGRVAGAYTIGEAGGMFADLLMDKVPHVEQAHDLETAVQHAAAAARPGDTVLLSPACASFDQFRDYAARGLAFRAAVEAL